ncbi:TerB family tellurite resistance protein [Simiduia curdlanivorans]|uniref:TerB family tellurite resistance protein n=1 Tax=Simiduia curdlanivorans TaxID=1492769 RepID=A0ABV8V5J1_9GAMM|nr:TerB family tellurite resistance protein [Simiduia curdlanivorans]MDN3640614.1 TerB family tellurite resistance protein [Simiduia curdlanivorans]
MIIELLKKCFSEPTVEQHRCEKLAAIALLVEIAMADGSLDDQECASLKKAIEKSHNLTGGELDMLLENAKHEQRNATSSYTFTRVINDEFSAEEKFTLVQDMWAVAYADGNLDKYEEHAIRKLSELIHVPHNEFIRAKLLARPS